MSAKWTISSIKANFQGLISQHPCSEGPGTVLTWLLRGQPSVQLLSHGINSALYVIWPFHYSTSQTSEIIGHLLNASWHRKGCTVTEVCVAGSIMKHRHPGPYLIGARAHARVHKFSILEKRTGHVLKPLLVRSVHHDTPTLLYLVMLLNCYNRLQPWWKIGLYLVFLKHEFICYEK